VSSAICHLGEHGQNSVVYGRLEGWQRFKGELRYFYFMPDFIFGVESCGFTAVIWTFLEDYCSDAGFFFYFLFDVKMSFLVCYKLC